MAGCSSPAPILKEIKLQTENDKFIEQFAKDPETTIIENDIKNQVLMLMLSLKRDGFSKDFSLGFILGQYREIFHVDYSGYILIREKIVYPAINEVFGDE